MGINILSSFSMPTGTLGDGMTTSWSLELSMRLKNSSAGSGTISSIILTFTQPRVVPAGRVTDNKFRGV